MSKTIEELAQEMTKEEFIHQMDEQESCPVDFNLSDKSENCNGGTSINECHECWNEAIKDIQFKENTSVLFQEETSLILKQLAESEAAYKKMTEQRDNLKTQLLTAMDKYNLDKWENENFSITYLKAGTTTTIDSKKVKELYPEVFEECSKTSSRKASIRFKVK